MKDTDQFGIPTELFPDVGNHRPIIIDFDGFHSPHIIDQELGSFMARICLISNLSIV